MNFPKKIFIVFLCLIMLLPVRAAAEDITIKARSAILVEVNTGEVLYSQAADIMQYPASLTKLMTALIVYERCDLGEIVTVTESALAGLSPDGSSSGLKPGEMMSVENLLYCMLISSGNDSASVLGEHTGGSVEAFVEMMNNRANELGCTGTNFENPHGLHDANHYTTARDMYIIAHEFIKHEKLMEIANTISYVVPATNKSPQRILNTTNYLISGTKLFNIFTVTQGNQNGIHDSGRVLPCIKCGKERSLSHKYCAGRGEGRRYRRDNEFC